MQQPSDVVTWGIVVGILMPYLVAVVNQPAWSGTVKRIVTVAFALVFGALTALFEGNLNGIHPTPSSVLAAAAAVLVSSQAMYVKFAKPTADTIEAVTSPKPDNPGGLPPGV